LNITEHHRQLNGNSSSPSRQDDAFQNQGAMSGDAQEISLSFVFGIVGTSIAFTALLIAYLQLRRMRRIHAIYELA